MKLARTIALISLAALLVSVHLEASEKHDLDPTKIQSKVGGSYNFETNSAGISGSIGLDETRKINATYYENGDYSMGGSWLFPKGIMNVYISSHDDQTTYNLGTYVPLSAFGVDTGNLMLFPMAGLNYATFEDNRREDSYGAYAGGFALYPVSEKVALFSYVGYTAGTTYNSFWTGGGVSYNFTSNLSLAGVVGYDDTYGGDFTINLQYEF